jgi:hypothetical protein
MLERALGPCDKQRVEPRAMTSVDLLALVLGTALAATLPPPIEPIGPEEVSTGITIELEPGWPWYLVSVIAERLCLALAPVALLRGCRYGRIARPAEFFIVCYGLNKQTFAFVFRQFASGGAFYGSDLWIATIIPLGVILISVPLAACLILAIGRGRLKGWISTVLLIVAWIGAAQLAMVFLCRLTPFDGRDTLANRAAKSVDEFVLLCLYGVPAAAMFLRPRSGARRRTWVELCGIAIFSIVFLWAVIGPWVHSARRDSPTSWLALDALPLMISIVASCCLVKRFQCSWNRWFAARTIVLGYAGGISE